MRRLTLWIAVLGFVAVPPGCADLAGPNWFHPGPAPYQQAQAERTDPYPEPDVAPEIVGGRPLGYQKPPSEAARVQTEYSWTKRYGPPPEGLFRMGSARPPGAAAPKYYVGAPGRYGAPPMYPAGYVPHGPPPITSPVYVPAQITSSPAAAPVTPTYIPSQMNPPGVAPAAPPKQMTTAPSAFGGQALRNMGPQDMVPTTSR